MIPLTFGSCFAGIGGIDLGLERAGMRCRWQIEIDPYCQRVLEKHWPDVKRYGDIKEVRGHDLEAVDLVCGGFPCQDISVAGKRVGLEGKRSSLAFELLRLLKERRPLWVLLENSHHTWRRWVPRLREALGGLEYASLPLRLSAAEVGADHRRARAFVLAHADGELLRKLSRRWVRPGGEVASKPLFDGWGTAASRVARVADGVPYRLERHRAIGNAVVPQVAQWIGERIVMAAEDLEQSELCS